MGFKTRTKNGEGWSRDDVRWKTVPQTSGRSVALSLTGNAQPLSSTVDSRVRASNHVTTVYLQVVFDSILLKMFCNIFANVLA